MDTVLQGLWKLAQAFVDDILVFTDGTIGDHILDLQLVFDRLREHNLKFKPSICHFSGLVDEISRIPHQSEWYNFWPWESYSRLRNAVSFECKENAFFSGDV